MGALHSISDDRGDESFADDLNMGRGIVSGRVALLLRSTEIPPHRPNDLLPPKHEKVQGGSLQGQGETFALEKNPAAPPPGKGSVALPGSTRRDTERRGEKSRRAGTGKAGTLPVSASSDIEVGSPDILRYRSWQSGVPESAGTGARAGTGERASGQGARAGTGRRRAGTGERRGGKSRVPQRPEGQGVRAGTPNSDIGGERAPGQGARAGTGSTRRDREHAPGLGSARRDQGVRAGTGARAGTGERASGQGARAGTGRRRAGTGERRGGKSRVPQRPEGQGVRAGTPNSDIGGERAPGQGARAGTGSTRRDREHAPGQGSAAGESLGCRSDQSRRARAQGAQTV